MPDDVDLAAKVRCSAALIRRLNTRIQVLSLAFMGA
jgi:hypothetical protein